MKILPVVLFCLLALRLCAQLNGSYYTAVERGYRDIQTHRLKESMDEFHKALEAGYQLHNESLVANALTGLGRVYYYKSEFSAAIDTISLAIKLFKQLHKSRVVAEVQLVLSNIYEEQGDYEKAFESSRAINTTDSDVGIQKQIEIGNLYTSIQDYPDALLYYKKAFAIPAKRGEYPFRELNHRMARLYAAERKFDSARYFYDQALIGNPKSEAVRLGLGEYFNLRQQYDSALAFLLPIYQEMDSADEGNIRMAAMIGIADAYTAQRAFGKAVDFARPAYDLATERHAKLFIRDAALLLSTLYDTLKQEDLAYAYYKRYVTLKDSIVNDQLRGKLYAFRLSEEAERKFAAARIRLNAWMACAALVTAAILFLFFYRNLRLRNEKLTLKKRAADLEMQALRSQMNPHFIFNALSSINGFILNNQPTAAADYLARFSRLVRLVLELSSRKSIFLQDEIQILRLYLEMESLRFRDRFSWKISYAPGLEHALVPPLIFQPFCENAIWHGLLHKDGPGVLTIEFSRTRNMLTCVITDDGVGRVTASTIDRPGKEQRMGLNITAERLSQFNQSSFEIDDLAQGTRVCVKIRLDA